MVNFIMRFGEEKGEGWGEGKEKGGEKRKGVEE